ncbi:restriction endonuclease subunit S [Roseibium aggregatum]|uniref:Restriction endonuclease subunit S n=1 Tax=Roseibium aggregatum TaxID=187304 RepID=A0A926S8I6_9HYPH|nr:restriction endonuclease subunit S [Roseibium aggregatum]MBD1549595.1 restriction endonuclease subunit S [Roseibium aggregatum]
MLDRWESEQLGALTSLITSGSRGWGEFYSDNGNPFIRMTNLPREGIRLALSDLRFVKLPGGSSEGQRTQIRKGDILISITAELGKIGFVDFEPDRAAYVNQHVCLVRLQEGSVDPEFLAAYLAAAPQRKLFNRLNDAGAKSGLNLKTIERFPVRFPPLPEQRKIAEILRAWDEAIEKLQALRAAKESRFAAISQKLLGPSRAIGRNIPNSNWTLTTFGDVFTERKDRSNGLGVDDVVTVGKYAIRKQSEHFSRSVASKDQSNYWVISSGDFVYDPMSAYYGALGRYDGVQDGIVSPAYRVVQLCPSVCSDFMVDLLRSHHIRFLLETRSSQGNKEGKRRLLQRDEFAGIEFNLPPMTVQKEISRKLALFRQDIAATEKEIELVTSQKRGLMQKLLTGEWRVAC